ncbi:trophoblast glycoprotein isoform X2 [Drosophila busckii]|nr:trophoblast glycoprotein isoform X2 [Drosophila busckii]XP_017849047.1 trophoblast glycoprotein isoform X2 [Drosophila busckii]XP_017849048.1 trophoblast glycoprotein isoform X2 [Drosophila busckii]XP_017849049.1 trophoblast glycoprotein isoform X2 [Drosophila busckii]XP_017849050.1 trophoblast glycoprotein isoform X2 [Drosophila busckii]XP_017849051.1 trophoblast glycoprotein isoform X2 [Drosophila busckii]XP_017849052.1 trophoblast glycoprotein isoform X2 [Drosophila busckii]
MLLRTKESQLQPQMLLLATLAISAALSLGNAESSSSCGPNFPASCSCGNELYEGIVQFIVNCTNAGLRNTSVLEFMPEQVEILIFTGNYITELPWNVFGIINDYKQLKIVDMSRNHIREIRGKAYHHVPRVERLILNHNNLSISRFDDEVNHHHPRVFSNFVNLQSLHLTDAFEDNSSPQLSEDLHDIFVNSQLLKLQKLHLEQNEITHFKDRNVFCDLPSLRDLQLGDNLLKDINFEVRCLNNLRFLDLRRNKFEFVKPSDMRLLNELQERKNRTTDLMVDFFLNPFVCDCKLAPFRTWLQATRVNVRDQDNLTCFHGLQRADPPPAHIVKLDMNECAAAMAAAASFLNIAEDEQPYGQLPPHISGHTATLIFLLIVLSMILLGLLVALVYVSRDKLKFMMTPVFDNVAKKVQYTSIKDEDCPEVHV